MEEQENLEQNSINQENESKKDSILKRGLNRVGTEISKIAKNAYTGAKNFINEIQAHQEWNKQFETQGDEYTVFPLNFETDSEYYKHSKHIYAIKNPEQKYLIVRTTDKLNIGEVLFGRQKQAFQVEDFEIGTFNFPSDESQYPIECQKYFYKMYTKPVNQFVQYITNNQNVNVGDNNSGDITLVADFSSQLAEIKNAIDNYKPNLLNKHKKDEAIKLYGKFENCVVNKQKDQGLFDKFIKVLEVIAPIAVSIVNTIITAI